jgi:hypothetical protein
MLSSDKGKMGQTCSDTAIIREGINPPAVDSPWVICLVIGAMILVSLACIFYRSAHPDQSSLSGAAHNSPWPELNKP